MIVGPLIFAAGLTLHSGWLVAAGICYGVGSLIQTGIGIVVGILKD